MAFYIIKNISFNGLWPGLHKKYHLVDIKYPLAVMSGWGEAGEETKNFVEPYTLDITHLHQTVHLAFILHTLFTIYT